MDMEAIVCRCFRFGRFGLHLWHLRVARKNWNSFRERELCASLEEGWRRVEIGDRRRRSIAAGNKEELDVQFAHEVSTTRVSGWVQRPSPILSICPTRLRRLY